MKPLETAAFLISVATRISGIGMYAPYSRNVYGYVKGARPGILPAPAPLEYLWPSEIRQQRFHALVAFHGLQGIAQAAVLLLVGDAEALDQVHQSMLTLLWEQRTAQPQRIDEIV